MVIHVIQNQLLSSIPSDANMHHNHAQRCNLMDNPNPDNYETNLKEMILFNKTKAFMGWKLAANNCSTSYGPGFQRTSCQITPNHWQKQYFSTSSKCQHPQVMIQLHLTNVISSVNGKAHAVHCGWQLHTKPAYSQSNIVAQEDYSQHQSASAGDIKVIKANTIHSNCPS